VTTTAVTCGPWRHAGRARPDREMWSIPDMTSVRLQPGLPGS